MLGPKPLPCCMDLRQRVDYDGKDTIYNGLPAATMARGL